MTSFTWVYDVIMNFHPGKSFKSYRRWVLNSQNNILQVVVIPVSVSAHHNTLKCLLNKSVLIGPVIPTFSSWASQSTSSHRVININIWILFLVFVTRIDIVVGSGCWSWGTRWWCWFLFPSTEMLIKTSCLDEIKKSKTKKSEIDLSN